MYERFLAGDPAYDGRFFTGVLTTGIYCLPSCKARKAKPENVRFFPSCEAARSSGFRACRKCHPDDFERGADPVLETIEGVASEVRSAPERFPDVPSVVRRSGFGSTRLFELVRQHFHTTPADLLLRARLDSVKQSLLSTNAPLARIAGDAGFESLSVLHGHFRSLAGMTPAAYRALRKADRFTIALPADYPRAHFLRSLGRDPQSLTERLSGNAYATVLPRPGKPCLLTLELDGSSVRVRTSAGSAPEAHALVVGLLGLRQNPEAFARLARRLGLARLVEGRAVLRLPQTPSVFEALAWSVIGQQIHFKFACLLRRRLVERVGTRAVGGLRAHPTPDEVAGLEPGDLLPLQFSRQKAEYLIGAARLVAGGKLDLAALPAQSATRVERTLLGIRGLGPWSVNYLMMRSLEFPDCVPLGDTGVTSGLQTLFRLEERPDIDATRRLMAVFSPFRSLATAHLWQLNHPAPDKDAARPAAGPPSP
jgi:AraC family transcriptional regulator of adaptative response / DNA-3-methyladenine glycosylase II